MVKQKGDLQIVHSPFEYTELDITSTSLSNTSFHMWPAVSDHTINKSGFRNKGMLLVMPNKKAHSFSGSLFFAKEDSGYVLQDPETMVKSSFLIEGICPLSFSF